ncbi:hypothetical protein [Exiguobacterium artemiae]
MQLVGLISDRQSLKPLFGTLIVSALMTLLLFGFISRSNLRYAKMGKVKLFSLVYLVVILQLVVTYGMAFLADDINPALYLLTPTAFSALVLRNLLNERIALSSTLFMALAGTFSTARIRISVLTLRFTYWSVDWWRPTSCVRACHAGGFSSAV